jgi:hypothetical protein
MINLTKTSINKNQLESIINLHEKMRGCYFYSSPQNASSRRSYERYNSLTSEFEHNNQKITVIQDTECSCKNVYYSMKIYIDDKLVNKDIRFVKKILNALN